TVKDDTSAEKLINLYKESYQNDYFVRIREAGTFPSTKEVYGSNFCDIGLTYDEGTKRFTGVSDLDHVVQGAAGQAEQNMNKMHGIDEKTGIDFMPVFP